MESYYKSDKLTLQEIVFKHLNKILELTSENELSNKSRQVFTSNSSSEIKEDDFRKIYCEAVENLAYVLIPFFDEKITSKFNNYIEILNSLEIEFRFSNKELIDDYKTKYGLKDEQISNFVILYKLKTAKKLFMELNLLLKRKDYLKTSSFGEADIQEASGIVDLDSSEASQ